jgi:hypothetical protein
MKVRRRSPARTGRNLGTDSFSLSSAKTYLGRLIEKAGRGEEVYILSGTRRFLLQEVPVIDPIPMRPAGYFANCYSDQEIDDDNELAKASIVKPPKDLE